MLGQKGEQEGLQLDSRIATLAESYKPLALEILKELIRIPSDHLIEGQCLCQSESVSLKTKLKKQKTNRSTKWSFES